MGTYPENWPEISLGVKEDAGWRCVRCRHPDFSPGEKAETNEIGSALVRSGRKACDEICYESRYSHVDPLHLDGKQRVLTVHHLDGEKDNVKWWNLASLCQVCHLVIQGRVRMYQGYFLPISEWMKPYVAGFVAFTVLGEDLSRDEVMDRLDELLEIWSPVTMEGT